MTRIIAGIHGGRRLRVPADGTRPTSDRVREALFSTLLSEFGSLDGLRILDLFAGSGAVGLEALSRGAAHADLVEHDRKAADTIRGNVAELGATGGHTAAMSAARFIQQTPSAPYDVLFLDPPYAFDSGELHDLLESLGSPVWSQPDSLFIVERAKRDAFVWPATFRSVKDKKYGETILWYGRCHG